MPDADVDVVHVQQHVHAHAHAHVTCTCACTCNMHMHNMDMSNGGPGGGRGTEDLDGTTKDGLQFDQKCLFPKNKIYQEVPRTYRNLVALHCGLIA